MSKVFLHLEGLTVFLGTLYFYSQFGSSWWLFLAFLLVPDLSMVGYAINKKMGGIIYNAGHTYVFPLVLIISSVLSNQAFLLSLSLIWLAHIGMDRTIGYGLKYPSDFKETHLQKV
ncbi:DUF4260 domain-containing protein [Thalassobacillus sp. CUG 92003]|uniref:DUF4260 domain-containing protein n=1 Tax=Thalassobacillus sp. CUG 92003 TaxID=2736641 RepID=UPI0015E67194|nr:DUF4260 domain-containing protein [Thalassobacillus sp. CUG 92003]